MITQDIPYSIKRSIVFLSGFPGISADEESACNIGDPGLIPELGRSPGKKIGYPLQYSWASLVAQSVKNPPAMQRTGFDPLVGKFPWRREWQPTSVCLPGESHGQRILMGCSPWGCKELHTVVPFAPCLQSFLASGSFLMSHLFASGGQRLWKNHDYWKNHILD